MTKQASFNLNGSRHTVSLTEKAKDFQAISIKGTRWFQKSYGNTYHIAYISALIDGKWVHLGETSTQYGYGEHFLVTAAEWLIENGYMTCTSGTGYSLSNYNVCEAFGVDCVAQDVNRKRDL